ncbi:MAG: hypothetical protein IVW56_08860 [Candidatus Binataceae bacterium]|nr:hypothetical protein [Candidatus Binataceae bacterium]
MNEVTASAEFRPCAAGGSVMKIRMIGVLSLVGVAMSVAPVWAGAVGIQPNVSRDQSTVAIVQLEAQRSQVARAMQVPPENKGPALIQHMDQYSQLSDLIDRLQKGEPVAPHEIDTALQPTLR